MNRNRRLPVIAAFAVLVSFSGCFDDFRDLDKVKDFDWQPTLAVPLINSTFSFRDFVNETSDSSAVYADEDGLITFVYEDKVLSKTGETLYTLNNQDFQHSNSIPNPVINQYPFRNSIEFSETVEFDFSTQTGQQIDSVFLKDGTLYLDLNWNFNQPGEFEIIFKSLQKNSQEISVTKQFVSALNYFESIPLAGVKADLTGSGKASNIFQLEIRFLIINDGSALPFNPSYNLNVSVFTPRFQAIFGELGTIPFATNKGISNLDFFQDLELGTIELEDPRAILTISNSFGLGAETFLNKLSIRHGAGTTLLQGPITTDPILIPAVPVENMGSAVMTSVEISKFNSNLPDLIKNIPKEISLEFSGNISNPSSKDFVLDASSIDMNLRVELPFFGKVSALRLTHDFDVDGSTFEDLDNALLRFYTKNELPLDLSIQATFMDATGVPLLEIFGTENNLIIASQNDPDGNVISPGESTIELDLVRSELEKISGSEILRLEIEVSSFNNGAVPVKIFDFHQITFTAGVQSKFVTND